MSPLKFFPLFWFKFQVIVVRVYNFNDCTEAALELKQQIEEAKADLKKKGLKF